MTLVRDKGGSVIASGVAHGALNAVAGLTILSVSDPSFPWSGVVGVGGFVALGLMLALVAAVRARQPATLASRAPFA
ncbi:MAG TPA: hypothetical protein VG943_12555 [Caulobacterales bacterium]|nr:hypothetical protein [Caulobacterales bacterium]